MQWDESGGVRFIRHTMGDAVVVFGSRRAGRSTGPFASLNVGVGTSDEQERVMENRTALSAAVGQIPEAVATARQVHADRILSHVGPSAGCEWARGEIPDEEADGHITNSPGVTLAVITADCLPVAVYGDEGLALVHCGWRGLEMGLAARAAERVRGRAAAIGPGIGKCCFEVQEDVLSRFADYPAAVHDQKVDLEAVAREQLEASGVGEIAAARQCTCCNEVDFFSHRRDGGTTGRQGTIAWLR